MGLLDIAIGCTLVVLGLKGKRFYPARFGENRGLEPLPTRIWRGLFLLGGAVSILIGIYEFRR